MGAGLSQVEYDGTERVMAYYADMSIASLMCDMKFFAVVSFLHHLQPYLLLLYSEQAIIHPCTWPSNFIEQELKKCMIKI